MSPATAEAPDGIVQAGAVHHEVLESAVGASHE